MLRYLELIADYAEETAKIVIKIIQEEKTVLHRWAIDRINNYNELAHDLVMKSVNCFFTGDIQIANNLIQTLTVVEQERDRLTKELPETPRLCCLLWNISRIAYSGAGIAIKAINNSLEKQTKICGKS